MTLVSWSADPAGTLPGGRCHKMENATVQWAVWHDEQGRRHFRVINIDGELPDTFPEGRPLSPAEMEYGRKLVTRISQGAQK